MAFSQFKHPLPLIQPQKSPSTFDQTILPKLNINVNQVTLAFKPTQFGDLPIEIVLIICEMLEKEYQNTLGLCSKYLHNLLTRNFDLSLQTDLSARIRFLRCLEFDIPQYMTCRYCGRMNIWRNELLGVSGKVFLHHKCRSQPQYLRRASPFEYSVATTRSFPSRELVDLIHRATKWGPQYGRQHTILDGNMTTDETIGHMKYAGCDWSKGNTTSTTLRHNFEARVSQGQLIFHMRKAAYVTRTDPSNVPSVLSSLRRYSCIHWYATSVLEDEMNLKRQWCDPSGSTIVTKCLSCLTDMKLSYVNISRKLISYQLDIWRNYENYDAWTTTSENMFNPYPREMLDANEISRRDIASLFKSSENPTK